jgi:hypothetical protein
VSAQGWFTVWEVVASVGTVTVICGLFVEYGPDVLTPLKFWGEREYPKYEIKVESPGERKGGAFVVIGIVVELIGGLGIIVQSDRIETQHRREIAHLNARNMGLLSIDEIGSFNTCLKKATPKGKVVVAGGTFDSRAAHLAEQIRLLLSLNGYEVESEPVERGRIYRLGIGAVVATARSVSPPPPQIVGLQDAFRCIGLSLPVAQPTAATQWLRTDDVLIVVNESPP